MTRYFPIFTPNDAMFMLGVVILAAEPIVWLVQTWLDPAYGSAGWLVALACLAVAVWSGSSPIQGQAKTGVRKTALALLALTALSRLLSQVLAIKTLGGIALVIDVYAGALLLSLHLRKRAISPFWLAVAFGFSLPLERILQRSFGFALQHLSADGACLVLGGLFDRVECHGVRLIVDGIDVLVDLPCSGASTVLMLLCLFTLSATVARPNVKMAVLVTALVLVCAYLSNLLRITALAVGIYYHERHGGIDVMAQPWHDLIGTGLLALASLPILLWAALSRKRQRNEKPRQIKPIGQDKRSSPVVAGLFTCLAVIVVSLPKQAPDVSRRDLTIELPYRLNQEIGEVVPLSAVEQAYFTQFGGAAAKASYGSNSLLVTRTSSPLRHLHAPDECLRGLGLEVEYVGMIYEPLPIATYKATDAEGESYRVDVSFIADNGHRTANIAEAVWVWLQDKQTVWTGIQRVTPWDLAQNERQLFETALHAAFDLSTWS